MKKWPKFLLGSREPFTHLQKAANHRYFALMILRAANATKATRYVKFGTSEHLSLSV